MAAHLGVEMGAAGKAEEKGAEVTAGEGRAVAARVAAEKVVGMVEG